ncbi:MAG: response regulator [Nostocaceae cyanobacterium]|nr:response regulator [Nostocaceae cyanobacterium]
MDSGNLWKPPSQADIKRPLILAVEDNEDNLDLLQTVLMLMDYSFVAARDGNTGLSIAQQYQPDLILLDMMLPDIEGIELAHQLKQNEQTKAIPIIAVTAMARAQDRERAINAGCNEYITKPYDMEELEGLIKHYLLNNDTV